MQDDNRLPPAALPATLFHPLFQPIARQQYIMLYSNASSGIAVAQ